MAKRDTEPQATAVFDNGRRGAPRPGCDCLQCFGYCIVDRDKYARDVSDVVRTKRPAQREEELV